VYSYNFASGGATTDSKLVKPFADTVLSFVDQVDLYLKSAKETGFVKWGEGKGEAVWAVWIGVNVSLSPFFQDAICLLPETKQIRHAMLSKGQDVHY
jgi:hypothetical protein